MKRNWVIGLLALCALSFCIQLVLYPSLPETVPIHWNAAGEVDGWSGKISALLLGLLPFGMTILFAALPKLDPKRENYQKHMKIYQPICGLFVLFFIGMVWVVMLSALDFQLPVGGLISAGLGIVFIILGNFMPRIRLNYTFGIRLPWTLENETVWYKTHRVAGGWFMAAGVVFGVSGFLPAAVCWIGIVAVLAVAVGTSVYSWVIYKRETKQD